MTWPQYSPTRQRINAVSRCAIRQQHRELLNRCVEERRHFGGLPLGMLPDLLQGALPLMVMPGELVALQRSPVTLVLDAHRELMRDLDTISILVN